MERFNGGETEDNGGFIRGAIEAAVEGRPVWYKLTTGQVVKVTSVAALWALIGLALI